MNGSQQSVRLTMLVAACEAESPLVPRLTRHDTTIQLEPVTRSAPPAALSDRAYVSSLGSAAVNVDKPCGAE